MTLKRSLYSLSRNDKILLVLTVLSLSVITYIQLFTGYAGDKVWLLAAARKWLDGKRLYADIIEISPPLIIWIYSIPEYLHLHLGILPDHYYLVLLGIAAIGLSTFVSLQLIKLHPVYAPDTRKQVEFCFLLPLVLLGITSPLYFFDREHIFLVLVLPYIFRHMPSIPASAVPTRLKVIIGVMAGIGFCIKPHCLVVFAGIQIIYFLWRRSFFILASIENLVIYAIMSLYVWSVWHFAHEYITLIVPMALPTYPAINRRPGTGFALIALFAFAITFVDFRLRYRSPYRKDIFYLLTLCVPFMAYALSNNGWGYTWNPLISLIFIITGFVLWDFMYLKKQHQDAGLPFRPLLFGERACIINLVGNVAFILIGGLLTFFSCAGCDDEKQLMKDITYANAGKPLESFGTITIDFSLWSSLYRLGPRWETRFNHLWMLPKFFVSSPEFAQRNKWIIDYVGNAYAEDLGRYKPQLVFVSNTDSFYSVRKYVDLAQYLSVVPRFKDEWKHYRYVMRVEEIPAPKKKTEHSGYWIYRRIE